MPVAARDPTGPSLEVGGAACRAGLGDGIVGVTTTSYNAIETISIFGFSGAGIVGITLANAGISSTGMSRQYADYVLEGLDRNYVYRQAAR